MILLNNFEVRVATIKAFVEALNMNNNRETAAARKLGISRGTMRVLITELRLQKYTKRKDTGETFVRLEDETANS